MTTSEHEPAHEPTPRPASLAELLLSDVHRITGRARWRDVARQALLGEAYRYNLALRLSSHGPSPLVRLAARVWLRRLRAGMGINIPHSTAVGPGFFIGHRGGITVNAAARFGANCNLSHNVTVGVSRGRRGGVPSFGDRVYIGPGAVVVGAITIGDDVAIGANAVVNKDVPAGHTVAGNPSSSWPGGSGDYVNRQWPAERPGRSRS